MSPKIEGLYTASDKEKFDIALKQIESLVKDEPDLIANMANTVAVLYQTFNYYWVGFYLNKNGQLVLAPFQGPVACTRIDFDKGVCGHAATLQQTVMVPNVHEFPGHIACSVESQSEIVIPLVSENKTIFVLDVDSTELNFFNEEDQQFLEEVVQLLV